MGAVRYIVVSLSPSLSGSMSGYVGGSAIAYIRVLARLLSVYP